MNQRKPHPQNRTTRGTISPREGRTSPSRLKPITPQERQEERRRKKLSCRLGQLLASLALFLLVFLGQGIYPQKIALVSQDLLAHLEEQTDFPAALSQLGSSLGQEEDFFQEVSVFCQTVFGLQPLEEPALTAFTPQESQPAFQSQEAISSDPEPETEPESGQEGEPVLGQVLTYIQQDLPETHSPHHLYLGEALSVAPLPGVVTSEFGPREDPFTLAAALHNGVDLSGAEGEPILAWRDGQVLSVAESKDFGLCLTLDHGEEIRSFYAHCSEILVEQGEEIQAGQEIAKVGQTGKATGPHLHLELTWQGLYLNPLHYFSHGEILS